MHSSRPRRLPVELPHGNTILLNLIVRLAACADVRKLTVSYEHLQHEVGEASGPIHDVLRQRRQALFN